MIRGIIAGTNTGGGGVPASNSFNFDIFAATNSGSYIVPENSTFPASAGLQNSFLITAFIDRFICASAGTVEINDISGAFTPVAPALNTISIAANSSAGTFTQRTVRNDIAPGIYEIQFIATFCGTQTKSFFIQVGSSYGYGYDGYAQEGLGESFI